MIYIIWLAQQAARIIGYCVGAVLAIWLLFHLTQCASIGPHAIEAARTQEPELYYSRKLITNTEPHKVKCASALLACGSIRTIAMQNRGTN